MRFLQRLFASSAVFTGLALTGAQPAWAECGNQCKATIEPLLVEPPAPSCVVFKSMVTECSCAAWFQVWNDCESDVVAKDFTFEDCTEPGTEDGCSVVTPGYAGGIRNGLEALGPAEWTYTLESSEGEHQVTLRANVREFVEPGGCAMSGPRSSSSPALLAAALFTAQVLRARRRRLRCSRAGHQD